MSTNLFQAHFAFLREEPTMLPFSAGGVTQHGAHPQPQNNQDAMALDIDKKSIIAVVCDGCAGASPLGRNAVSMNETGAQLTCMIAVKAVRWALNKNMSFHNPDIVAARLSERIQKEIFRLSSLLGYTRRYREHVLSEFFTATLLCTVITPSDYLIFGSGDGITGVNSVLTIRDDHEGEYLAGNLILLLRRRQSPPESPYALRCLGSGLACGLQNIFLATDGVYDMVNGAQNLLLQTLDTANHALTPGYDPLFFREFRMRVAAPLVSAHAQVVNGNHDDRTLIMVRRLNGASNETSKGKQSC